MCIRLQQNVDDDSYELHGKLHFITAEWMLTGE